MIKNPNAMSAVCSCRVPCLAGDYQNKELSTRQPLDPAEFAAPGVFPGGPRLQRSRLSRCFDVGMDGTVAILAQGTNRAVAVTQALFHTSPRVITR